MARTYPTIQALGGVDLTIPVIDEVLTYDGTSWTNAVGGGGGSPDRIVHALSGTTVLVEDTTVTAWKPNVPYDNVKLMTVGPHGVAMGVSTGYGTYGGASATQYPNVALGTQALELLTTGYDNVAIGYMALRSTTSGQRNVALASGALHSNIIGNGNVAIGSSALYNTTGSDNTAVGTGALSSNITTGNVAIGSSALYTNTSGNYNTAVGTDALTRNSVGVQNTAMGHSALKVNDLGGLNTAVGVNAAAQNQTGSYNTAIGHNALNLSIIGDNNTAIGADALATTTGDDNTAVGEAALFSLTTGINNVAVGHNAGADAVANLTTQSNYVVLGNDATTNANIKVAWTVTSDGRDKTEIEPLSVGLPFVLQLQPKQFKLMDRGTQTATTGIRYGLVAQDIVPLEPTPVVINTSDPDNLKLNETMLIPILIKAVQELSTQLAAVTDRLTAIENTP